jgi:hypothetical protein
MNQLHALAMGQGLCLRKKLWTTVGRQKFESLTLDPWASFRRRELLQLLDQLDPSIEELNRAVISEAESRPTAVCLMQQAGGGAGDCTSVRVDRRTGEPLCEQQKTSELSGLKSQRGE